MNYSQSSSPGVKLDYTYNQSSPKKKPHPYNLETSQASLRNSFNLKDFGLLEELEYFKQRCNDMDAYIRQLKAELEQTILKSTRTDELDSKVELVLKQNQALSVELDRSQKLTSQKKTETDLWKQKYETQLNQAVQLKAGYELDLRNLSLQILGLEERNEILERERNRDVEGNKHQAQLQNELQRQHYQQQLDLLEGQIRKLRQYAEEQEKEVYEVQARFERSKEESDREQSRLSREIEVMRSKLQEKEMDNQKDLSNLRSKLEILSNGALVNVKAQFQTQMEIVEGEVHKLKELLGIKNVEIETLIVQNQKQKANYEDEINTVRLQCDILKGKIRENEHNFENQLTTLEQRLRRQYENDITQLLQTSQREKAGLEAEISQQIIMIDMKNKEIQQLQDDKTQAKVGHNQDQAILKGLMEASTQQITRLESQRITETHVIQERHNAQLQTMQDFSDQQRQQIEFQTRHIEQLQNTIQNKQIEIEGMLKSFSNLKQKLDEDYQRLRQDYELLYLHQQQLDITNQRKISELNYQINLLKLNIDETSQLYNNEKDQYMVQIRQLSQEIDSKDRDFEQLFTQKQLVEKENRKYKEELQNITNKHTTLDLLNKRNFEIFKVSSENNNLRSLEDIKTQTQIQVGALLQELSQVRTKLEMKTKELYVISEKYINLESGLQELRSGQDDSKEFDHGFSTLNADIRVTKSLYDSFAYRK